MNISKIARAVKNTFTLPKNTFCRLDIPLKYNATPKGDEFKKAVEPVLSAISNDEGRRYFIVKMDKSAKKMFYSLYEDDLIRVKYVDVIPKEENKTFFDKAQELPDKICFMYQRMKNENLSKQEFFNNKFIKIIVFWVA